MRILFATQILGSGIGIVRAKWPARWVNKFTEHMAECMDESDLEYSDLADIISKFDVVSIHKASSILARVAREAKSQGKIVIYDTDDNDEALYDKYYMLGMLQGQQGHTDQICEVADGITCTSLPLARRLHKYGKPVAVCDNGYDLTLDEYQIQHFPYFEGSDGEWLKIIYGGSTGHTRDLEMFFKLGVIEELAEYKIDWCFYGALAGPSRVKQISETSKLFFNPGEDIASYMQSFYSDASILIAPLVIDDFNHCRSLIKPVEAGIAGIPAVVSNVESYRNFSEGTTCVENTKTAWTDALRPLILDNQMRTTHGNQNRKAAYARHHAEILIKERMSFYENF